MQARRLSAAITALAGVALLALTQFYPWATTTAGPADDPSLTVKSDLYGARYETENGNASHRWWGESFDHDAGIGQVRLAIPLLGVALVVALAAAVMTAGSPSLLGPALSFLTGALAASGVWMFVAGLGDVLPGSTQWQSGFWFGAFGALDLVLAGVMGFLAHYQALRFARFEMER